MDAKLHVYLGACNIFEHHCMEDYKILLKVNLVHPACFATLHFTSSPIKFPLSFLQPLFLSYSHLPPTWVSRTIQTSHRQSLITSKHRGHLFFFLPSADSLSSQVQDPYSATPWVHAFQCRYIPRWQFISYLLLTITKESPRIVTLQSHGFCLFTYCVNILRPSRF